MRATKTTLKHIRRSPYQSLAAVFIMMLTFLSITIFSFIVFGSSSIINYFESKPQVTAFFKDEATAADILFNLPADDLRVSRTSWPEQERRHCRQAQ